METKNSEPLSPDTNDKKGGEQVITDVAPPTASPNTAPEQTDKEEADPSETSDQSGSAAEGTPASEAAPTAVTPMGGEPKRTKSPKVLLVVIALLLLAIIGVAAYALATNKSSKNSSAATTTTVKKDIANLRYVTSVTGWNQFYPGIDTSSNFEEANREIFEGLVRYENRTKIVPLLATGWTNPDSTTWVFNLQKGVKFHTGREMTADDVKASFDAVKGTDMGDQFGDTIASVTVTGPSQVTIKTTDPDATLLNKLTNLYIFDTKSGKQNDPINGTGAYTLKPGTTPTATSLELVAFDQYHGGRPHVRSVSFIGLPDNDHAKAYGDGKADIMSLSNDTPTATGTRKYSQINLQPLGVQIMPLNTLKPNTPLAKLKVRQALEDTLNAAAIAKARGVDYESANQMVPKAIPGYNPDVKQWKTDIAAAKQLLTEAGYPKGFTMKLTYFSPVQSEAAEIAKEAAQVGINITLDPQTDPTQLGPIVFGGKTDATLLTQTSDILDSSDALSTFDDTPLYSNQQVVDLVSKAQSTLDASKRISYLEQANKAMADDVGVIPLFVQADKNSIIYNPSYVVQRDIENNDLGIYFWKVYAK